MTKDESTPSAVHFGSNCEHSNDSFPDLGKRVTVHGESQWLNINSKIMKEKKKFNADVSDLLVLEVLKRKELLIENNTSRDLTFSESKRNAWNDVRGLLMDKFPYFDLNVEAIKSHWRYRKRKVTDIYQDLKCSKSESSILSKISTIDRAIYEMLVDSNMLDSKSSKHEVSTSEGEEQTIENLSAPDHSSSSISPASAFTTPNNASLFFQPQYYQRQSTVQNNHSHNRSLQTTFGGNAVTLQQQIQQLLQNAAERSQPQPQSNILGFNPLTEINVPPTNFIADPLVPIFGTATSTQHQNAAFMQKLFLLFQHQEQQRVQQQEQSLLLNSPESTNSPDVEEAPKVENVGKPDAVRAGNSYEEHESTIDVNNNIDGEMEFEPEVKNDCSNVPSIILQTVAGAEKFGTHIQAALRSSVATADSRRKRHTRSPPSVTVLRSQKAPRCREDEMEAASVENSIETQALMAQHSAFAELESFVIELKRLVVPEAIKALKNYNSTFVRQQSTNTNQVHYKTSDHPSID